ncbi:transcriptional repressor TCF25-domain-containing protein [Myxozyma melibiosi]|uniref:Transcriptional repressor TCF25-domain-containing protein n=1 Tax=Myxozyma melibiosi TaxID=54550 RepID=A0ABR1EYJ7_9ASCO
MSSRAVRRALQLQQMQQQKQHESRDSSPEAPARPEKISPFAALAADGDDDGDDEDEDVQEEEEEEEIIRPKPSLFALLGEDDDDNSDDQDKSEPEEEPVQEVVKPAQPSSSKKKSKKSKKKKAASSTKQEPPAQDLDEIDRALAELNLKSAHHKSSPATSDSITTSIQQQQDGQAAARLLSVNTKNLDPSREMRKAFGRRVLQDEAREARRAAGRRGPVAGRQAFARKYVLVQPGEDWPPLALASGISMEVIGTEADITKVKFTHSRDYMRVQAQFYTCIQIGDPEMLVHLLQNNVYHVSTLLQVAEILTHHGEHTKAAKTVEHALFAYDKAFHSLFNISSGRVRLPFKYYENRGFYLAVYRHVLNLGRRGTWGTAFEFLKLLLAVSAEEDAYCVLLMIDVYAIHAAAEQFLIDLSSAALFADRIKYYPNIAFSLALAYFHKGDQEAAENALATAASTFPWTLSALAFALGLDVPPQLMKFNEKPSAYQELMTQLYIERALPIWSSPATKTFLETAIERVKSVTPSPPAYALDPKTPITRDIARHVLLSEIKSVLELLPRDLVAGEEIWTDDILPPDDNISPYATNPFEALRTTGTVTANRGEGEDDDDALDGQDIATGLWHSLLQWRQGRRNEQADNEDDDNEEDDFDAAQAEIEWALAHQHEQGGPTARELTEEEVANLENEEEGQPGQARQSYFGSLFQRFAGILRTDSVSPADEEAEQFSDDTDTDEE